MARYGVVASRIRPSIGPIRHCSTRLVKSQFTQYYPKDRGRQGGQAIKMRSGHSWVKHGLLGVAVHGQLGAYRRLHPTARVLLIDGNAGDGLGVEVEQGQPASRPTPQMLIDLAKSIGNADVCLCELARKKRKVLWRRYPGVPIVGDNSEALSAVRTYHEHAFWLSDPCGPKGHCVASMRALDKLVPCDFIVAFNEGPLIRMQGTHSHWEKHLQRYGAMLEPKWWLDQLGKRYMARSRIISASKNFRFRLLVVADVLADAAWREPFTEIITSELGHEEENSRHPVSDHQAILGIRQDDHGSR